MTIQPDVQGSAPVFAGVDVETTGNDPTRHVPIQIAVVTTDLRSFVSDIGWDEPYAWEQEALDINGFSHDRIRRGPHVAEVDRLLASALREWGVADHRLVAIGWNVGSFDLQYVRAHFPLSWELFSYRSVDLNSLCYTTGRFYRFKERVKDASVKRLEAMGATKNLHDAGWDALAALAAWEWIREHLCEIRNRQGFTGLRRLSDTPIWGSGGSVRQ